MSSEDCLRIGHSSRPLPAEWRYSDRFYVDVPGSMSSSATVSGDWHANALVPLWNEAQVEYSWGEKGCNVANVGYITFPHIDVPHACSTRVGGVSQGDYAGLNIGQSTKDVSLHVHRNRMLLEGATGVPVVSCLNMVHGTKVIRLDALPKTRRIGDACITNVPGVPLMITTADCVPIVFYDPVRRAIGLAHGGWRGTVARIVVNTVASMQAEYGCRPEDLRVAVGPSIGPCCFAVHDDVLAPFAQAFAGKELAVNCGNSSCIDLWRANLLALEECGVSLSNVCVTRVCTSCQNSLFFSYRRDRGTTGRMASVIVLPE